MDLFVQLWDRALINLEEDLNVYVIKNWIREMSPIYAEENNYYFSVETEMQKNNIEERFLPAITRAMCSAYAELTGGENKHIHPVIILDEEVREFAGKHQAKKAEQPKQTQPAQHHNIPLDPQNTFDTFVVGECNRFANQAAITVARNPGKTYNPLFLYGGPSLGKTHLIHAIGNHILAEKPDAKLVYVSSETFMNEFISMLGMTNRTSKMDIDVREEFRSRYRNIDVLLIDDIQFLTGKDAIQDEFFHTFNALHQLGRQIVITSDKPPRDLQKMEERLLSRFEWGITVDIKPPDYETRVAILIEKAQLLSEFDPQIPDIDPEVFHYIASLIKTDVRKLEGALRKVIAYAEFSRGEDAPVTIDQSIAQAALADYIDKDSIKILSPEYILEMVSKQYHVSVEDMKSTKKNKEIAYPRQISQYIMRAVCDMTYEKIASFFGKHYSTVMHAEEKIKKDMEENAETKNIIEDLIARIRA